MQLPIKKNISENIKKADGDYLVQSSQERYVLCEVTMHVILRLLTVFSTIPSYLISEDNGIIH